jgi:hypothetical protein
MKFQRYLLATAIMKALKSGSFEARYGRWFGYFDVKWRAGSGVGFCNSSGKPGHRFR